MLINRTLDLPQLIEKKSHFLFGPRGTGKTQLILQTLSNRATLVDLLSDDIYSRLLRRPSLLNELISQQTQWVVIDEIQKIPALLDEVHRLIETRGIRFLLTGSSARKLKRGAANLLGGRAWEASLFPLTFFELGQHFELIKYLNCGGLPAIYFSQFPADELRHYTRLYLREEIQAEAVVKRIDHFARFLDVASLTDGEELNFEAVANDSGVPARTVASYFEVLEDTLLGFQVHPFLKTKKRKAIKRSKFYFFDVGVAGALARRGTIQEGSELFGRAFENFVMQELRSFISYRNLDLPLCYWRSTSHQEVDAVIGDALALEIKATEHVAESHLAGLRALAEEKKIKDYILISRDPIERHVSGIHVMPWNKFLRGLWSQQWL